ncbi:hypothetical protein A1O1_04758 [Capronia coronata CBS 617.96]|uniref:O-methyltransferase C-terminal domain-containing protein n=1 Tax=Capronia coronata CBS 617.96 TaxID=1182541 RepID=W9YF18_9EURO|nr:uncharacterized protein A1O1_04758 [Capronia coronata CBS 617.96]EXJ87831.1 hypothetical protein A1O1_04758 [Capronia coronata CBS 617.96]
MEEVGKEENSSHFPFSTTQITNLTDTFFLSSLRFDCCGPAFQSFPSFLAETGYQDVTDSAKTPFQKGHNTDLPSFQYLAQRPELFNALQTVMTAIQSADWMTGLDIFDRSARAAGTTTPQTPIKPFFFVDVGGGHGHQCRRVLEKYPALHGRLVLQDLPEAVEKLAPMDGVKVMAQDFFQKQAVQDAQFYYLRRIMHDWPDASCLKILANLSAAMTGDSRILIDEVVLPDVNVPWQAAMTDVSMACQLAGKERTRAQWESLVQQSGLRLVQIHTYNRLLYTSVIVLEKQ